MVTKPRAFIFRVDRLKDEIMLCDTSSVVSINIDTDLNHRTIIVRTTNPDIFKRTNTLKFPGGDTYTVPVNDDKDSKPTYTFVTYFNYNGKDVQSFWRNYNNAAEAYLPKAYTSGVRNDIKKEHGLNEGSSIDVIKATRTFTDNVLNKKYVDADGLYAFEFIPLFTKLVEKAPLIPEDDDEMLKLYSKCSKKSVEQIKDDVFRKFGYQYKGFTPKSKHTDKLSLDDIMSHIHLMLSIYAPDYGITEIKQVKDFKTVSTFGKITYAGGTTLRNLIEKLRKSFFLRIWQEYPFYNIDNTSYYTKWIENLSEFTTKQPGSKGMYRLLTTFDNNNEANSLIIGYTEVFKNYGIGNLTHLYDLITDINVGTTDPNRNNAFLDVCTVQFATGIKLNMSAVVEMKKFGNRGDYDVYLKVTLVNTSNVEYTYGKKGTKYFCFKYRNWVKSEYKSDITEFTKHMNPKPGVAITAPLPSPFNTEETVTAGVIASGISISIDKLCDNIKCNGSQAYKMEMTLRTPLFQQSTGDIIYVNQLYPYNTNGKVRKQGDMILYCAAVDRINETISADGGYDFDVHCGTGEIVDDNISLIGGSFVKKE